MDLRDLWSLEVLGGGGQDFFEAGERGENRRLALVRADHKDVTAGEPRHERERWVPPALALEAEGKLPRRDP
jgi:hypothetical protein